MAWASITYPEHPSTLVAAVSTYYEQESYMDVSFMCAGLERVEAHRLVLTSVSPFMKTLLMEHSGPEPPVISLPDVSQHLLRLVLQFLYDGVMKVNQDELAEFKNILTVLGIKVPNATVVKLNERIPAKLNPTKDPFVRRPPKRPSPVARSRSPALVAVPPPTPSKVTNVDPSDDPLNVPDFYFRPQPSQPETADVTVGSAAASTATPIMEPDPMPMDDEEEEEEAAALEVPVVPVSRSSVTPQTSPPITNTSRRSTRSSIKPATPQPTPQRPPSPEVLIKVEREDEEMSQSNSSLVNTSLLRTTLKTENPEYLQMEFTQNETEQERRERATDILGSPNCRSQNEKKSSLFYNIDVNVVDASEPFKTVCEDRTESSRPMPHSWSNNDGTGPKNTPLTKKQLMCLRRAFKADPAPKQESYTVLAKELGLSATNVWHWFFYERYKIKTKRKITRKNSPYLFPNSKQLETLNKSFLKDKSPSKKSIQMLSKKLRLKQIIVCNWFSNMRRGAQFLPEGECASNSEISNTRDSILCKLPDRSIARKKLGLNRSQVENLNKECSENNRPSHKHMQELAKQLNIPFRKVYLWFYDDKGKGENKNCKRYRNKKTNVFSSPKEPNIHQDIRRKRNLLSLKQLSILKEEFVVNCYPSKERRKLLSTQLGLRERSVFNWFSRVRRKMLRAELSINNKAARQRILATISKKNKQKDTQIKTGLLNSDIGEYTNKDHSHEQLKEISITPGEPYQSQFKTCRQTEETRGTNQSGDRHKSQVKKCSRGLNKLKNHKHPMVRKGTMCFLYSHQLSRLKEEFVGNGYLTKQGRERVARELCLDKMKVCKWFSDARRKMTWARLNVNKREHREKIVMSYRNRCGQQ